MSTVNWIVRGCQKMSSQPLSCFDIILPYPMKMMLVYDHCLDEKHLIKCLEKAMKENPYVSGRIINTDKIRSSIIANDGGSIFSVEVHNYCLPCEFHDFFSKQSEIGKSLLFDVGIDGFDPNTPLLQVKLSKFKNASILGILVSHALCDLYSFFHFLLVWSRIAKNEDTRYTPVFNRGIVAQMAAGNGESSGSFLPITKKTNGQIYENYNFSIHEFVLKNDFINSLKNEAKEQLASEEWLSDSDLWSAFIWKQIASCQSDEVISFTNVYNARGLTKLSYNYFGNAIVIFKFEKNRNEILNMPIVSIAKLLKSHTHNLIKEIKNIGKDIAYLEARIKDGSIEEYQADVLLTDGKTVFNNISMIPIYDIDFGSGSPIRVHFPFEPEVGLMRSVRACPTRKANGDILLQIALPDQEMQQFTQLLKPCY